MPRPCRANAVPVPCHDHAVLKMNSQGHGTARYGSDIGMAWHGMCKLASVVQRRIVGDQPAFGLLRLPRGFPQRLLSEAYQFVKPVFLNLRALASIIPGRER
jgi:hypothetical protein